MHESRPFETSASRYWISSRGRTLPNCGMPLKTSISLARAAIEATGIPARHLSSIASLIQSCIGDYEIARTPSNADRLPPFNFQRDHGPKRAKNRACQSGVNQRHERADPHFENRPVLFSDFWSGREDLNLRPLGPEPSALPG